MGKGKRNPSSFVSSRSILADVPVARQIPFRVGQRYTVHASNRTTAVSGDAQCYRAGNGVVTFIGRQEGSIWEASAPYDSVSPVKEGYGLGTNATIEVHERGSPKFHLYDRHI